MSDSFIEDSDATEIKTKKFIRRNPTKSPMKLFRRNTTKKENSAERDDFSPLVRLMLEDTKTDDLQYQLLKMMYIDDVDADFVKNYLGITSMDLKNVVDELVFMGLLQYTTDDEVELTKDGIDFVTSKSN